MKRFIISTLIALPMLLGASAYADEITVYMTIEKLTLGQGYIMEPTAVNTAEGTSVAQLLEDILPGQYMHTGTLDDNLYVSAFADIEEEVNIPQYLLELIGEPTTRQDGEWLSEFDYCDSSGWKFSVNNEFPSVSASDYILNDGDVIRWQFSLYGYGTDLEEFSSADKSELIKAAANGNYSDYAYEVLTKPDSSGEEVNDAYIELESGTFSEDSGYTGANLNLTAQYISTTVTEPQIAQVGGEWAVLGLARSGVDINQEYFDGYYGRVVDTVRKNNGVIHERKYTEYARVIIALSAIGKNPTNVSGYDIVSPLTDFDMVMRQGTNGAVFALLAMDCCDYQSDIRERYIAEILSRQSQNGGFSLSKNGEADVDITAMAIAALSRYSERSEVNTAIENALTFISEAQQSDGGFAMYGEDNCESAVQVIVALTSAGIPLDDERFVKNGTSVLDYLLGYASENGGFRHTMEGEVDLMATEQALYALASTERANTKKASLYDMETEKITAPKRAVLTNITDKTFELAERIYD